MITYNIRLRSIGDFRKFSYMNTHFHIRGYVQINGHQINMYDILDILGNGAVDQAELVLTQYRPEELSELDQYLHDSELLADGYEVVGEIA